MSALNPQQASRLKSATNALREQNAYLAALHETTLALMNRLKLSEVLQSIVTRAAALAGTAHGYLFQLEPNTGTMAMQVGIGFFAQRVGDHIQHGQSVAGLVWHSGQPLVVRDYPHWSGRVPHPVFDQLRILLGVPLQLRGQVVGVLGLGYLEANSSVNEATVERLVQFAQLASIALDNARWYTAAQQELTERKQAEAALQRQNAYLAALHETTLALVSRLDLHELLEGIVNRAGTLLGTSHGYVFLLTPDSKAMEMRVGVGIYTTHIGIRAQKGQGLVGQVWQTGQAQRVTNYLQWAERRPGLMNDVRRTVLVVPLKFITQVVGALGLAYVEEERTFGADEMAVLNRFAELASIALDNAQLYQTIEQELHERKRAEDALQRQTTRLQIAADIGRIVTSLLDLDAVLPRITDLLCERFGYYWVGIVLPDETRAWGELRAASGESAQAVRARDPRLALNDKSLVGYVLTSGQARIAQDVSADKLYFAHPLLPHTQSEAAIPLLVGDTVIGVLDVQSAQLNTFTPGAVSILTTLAGQIAVAIHNAQLHAAEKERARELEQAYQVLQANQQQLLISEKMASLGRLTAGIAHEMNTPLAAMRASLSELAQLVQEYQASSSDPDVTPDDHRQIAAEMQQAIQLANSAGERAAGFVRGIKAQTRDLATREQRRFNAVPVLREALLLLSHELRRGNCTLRFEPASDVIELHGSPGRLAQVITNLVTNAIDASASRSGAVHVRLEPHDQHIALQVSDQGSGIAPEHLTKIFEPMFTTKPFGQGTGLGLAIVHDVVVAEFGGTVTVQSEVGQGTTFTIQFPRPQEG